MRGASCGQVASLGAWCAVEGEGGVVLCIALPAHEMETAVGLLGVQGVQCAGLAGPWMAGKDGPGQQRRTGGSGQEQGRRLGSENRAAWRTMSLQAAVPYATRARGRRARNAAGTGTGGGEW